MNLNDILKLFHARREWREKVEKRRERLTNKFHKAVAKTVITNMTPEQFEKYLENCHSIQELDAIAKEIKEEKARLEGRIR